MTTPILQTLQRFSFAVSKSMAAKSFIAGKHGFRIFTNQIPEGGRSEYFHCRPFAQDLLLKVIGGHELILEDSVFIRGFNLFLGTVKRQRFVILDLIGIHFQTDGLGLPLVNDNAKEMAEEFIGLELLGDFDRILCLLDGADAVQGIDTGFSICFAFGKKIPTLLEKFQAPLLVNPKNLI